MAKKSNKKAEAGKTAAGISNGSVSRGTLILREGALLGWLAVCCYLLLALITYSTVDPGWSHTSPVETVSNAAGRAGAWIADVFFSLFGYVAYFFPLLVALRAWDVFHVHRKDESKPIDWIIFSLRALGLLIVMISATALTAMHYGEHGQSMPFGAGGILGSAVGEAATHAFNHVGSTLILTALFLFGLTVFAEISWLLLIDRTGMLTLKTIELARRGFANYRANRKERKVAQLAQQKRKETVVTKAKQSDKGYSPESLDAMSRMLESKLLDFGISAQVTEVLPGPVITRFEIQPAAGVKVSRISNLAKDLARSLAVISVRVVEVIPGKSVVGIEIPNEHREMVRLSEVISSDVYDDSKSPLTLALGHDISGMPVTADLARMPHLLVAGTTGSGKSVGINAMLLSLLYKATPEEVRLILVDPKMLELSVYDGIPHLLTPVVTDMNEAAHALRWCVGEMERRYKLMAALGVRNLSGFNRKVRDAAQSDNPIPDPLWQPDPNSSLFENEGDAEAPPLQPLPYIVVVIDEFADMMMIVGKKVEQLIARIAQKARAAGIHLILATQRPSVDVITGLIKANVPTRIGFQVSSKIDSRTILDQGGAEQLLGHGDMLYLPPGTSVPVRVHGAFVDDHEVHKVVADWQQRGEPEYLEEILDESSSSMVPVPGFSTEGGDDEDGESDPLYDEAVAFVLETRKASISSVQRKLRIGYNRAARLIEQMEASGVVSAMSSNGNREVLAPSHGRD
ncbi:MAG: DNA translocase FtsK [bacterium]